MSDTLLTPAELAERWQIGTAVLSQWRYQGKGPVYIKLGHHVRYRLKDVEDFENSNTYRMTGHKIEGN